MFTNRKPTGLLVNVGTFRNVTFYITDLRSKFVKHNFQFDVNKT